jgi:hypothetical protein
LLRRPVEPAASSGHRPTIRIYGFTPWSTPPALPFDSPDRQISHARHALFARRANVPQARGIAQNPKSAASFRLSRAPREGRIAIVTDVGCGMRWTLWRRKTSGTNADGEVVWS